VDFSKLKPVHEQRMLLLALASGLPAVITVMIILWWQGDYTPKVQWTLTVVVLGGWWACAVAVRDRVASPLRTLANLLEAMREGDYSIRARGASGEEALGDVMQQVNAMATTLREQRLGALEATTLLRKVMEEIDVAIFAFDSDQQLRLVNRAGERLLAQPSGRRRNAEHPADVPIGRRTIWDSPVHVSRRRIAASAIGGDGSYAGSARGGIAGLAEAGAGVGA
jgi:two-component system nitrogen regulation sensor histidine kinase NtrY